MQYYNAHPSLSLLIVDMQQPLSHLFCFSSGLFLLLSVIFEIKKQEKSLITFPEGDNADCCVWLVYTIFI